MRKWINIINEIDLGGELEDPDDEKFIASHSVDSRQYEMFDTTFLVGGSFDGYEVAYPEDTEEHGVIYGVFKQGEPVAYIRLADMPHNEDELDCYRVDGVRVFERFQGQNIAARLYHWLVTKGHIDYLYSDEIQTESGAGIWRKLLQIPELVIELVNEDYVERVVSLDHLKQAYERDHLMLRVGKSLA